MRARIDRRRLRREITALAAGATVALVATAWAPAAAGRGEARVAFHLARAEVLRAELAPVVYGPCPKFPTPAAWDAYLAGLADEGVTFAAHLGEAWREAKAAGDAALRDRVKAARRRMLLGDPVRLVGKVTSCAWQNGSSLDAWGLWRRASEDVRRRRQEVAREADLAARRP